MDPESQELQLRRAGVPWENLVRDVGVSGSTGTRERRGWHRLDARLAGGDTLVVAEKEWTQYLEADEGSPEAFFGQILTMFAAWVADQELESIKRRTRDGLERARQQGKALGPPRKIGPGQMVAMRRMREGGASLRRIAGDFECSPSTVLRALRREK